MGPIWPGEKWAAFLTTTTSELVSEVPEQQRQVVDLEERTWLTRHLRGDASAFPALLEAYPRPKPIVWP